MIVSANICSYVLQVSYSVFYSSCSLLILGVYSGCKLLCWQCFCIPAREQHLEPRVNLFLGIESTHSGKEEENTQESTGGVRNLCVLQVCLKSTRNGESEGGGLL